jgi:hypothetical protein
MLRIPTHRETFTEFKIHVLIGYNGAFLWNNFITRVNVKKANTLNYFKKLMKERENLLTISLYSYIYCPCMWAFCKWAGCLLSKVPAPSFTVMIFFSVFPCIVNENYKWYCNWETHKTKKCSLIMKINYTINLKELEIYMFRVILRLSTRCDWQFIRTMHIGSR